MNYISILAPPHPLHSPVQRTTAKSSLIQKFYTYIFGGDENVHFDIHTSTYQLTELSVLAREGELLQQQELDM
jgi:hypothetical protein